MTSRWHTEPKNEAWREVHLAHVENLGSQLWLRCNACGHSLTPEPREFAHLHHLDMETPLQLLAHAASPSIVLMCGRATQKSPPDQLGLNVVALFRCPTIATTQGLQEGA